MSATSYFRTVSAWICDAARRAVWRLWYDRHGICGAVGLGMWRTFVSLGMPVDSMAVSLGVSQKEIWKRLRVGAIKKKTGLRFIADLCYSMNVEPKFSITPKEASA